MSRMGKHTREANCRCLWKIPKRLMGMSWWSATEAKAQLLTPSCQAPKAIGRMETRIDLRCVIKSSENRAVWVLTSHALYLLLVPGPQWGHLGAQEDSKWGTGWVNKVQNPGFLFIIWFSLAGLLAMTDSVIPTLLPRPSGVLCIYTPGIIIWCPAWFSLTFDPGLSCVTFFAV